MSNSIESGLVGNFDAQVWATEFCKAVKEKPHIASDESTMLGWFANAIMAGYDKGCSHADAALTAERDEARRERDELAEAVEKYGEALFARLKAEVTGVDVQMIEDILYDNEELAGDAMFKLATKHKEPNENQTI